MSPSLGSLVAQETISRVLAARACRARGLDWRAPFLPSVLGAVIGFVLGRVLSASVPALAALERRLTETRS